MKKLRGYIPTMLMLATLLLSTTAANAGIIVGGRDSAGDTNPCEEKESDMLKSLFTAAFDFAKTGIIVGGLTENDTCGIIVGGRTGIIVGG